MFTLALMFSRLFWKYCGKLLTAQSIRVELTGFRGAKQTSFRLAVRFKSSDQNSMFCEMTQKKPQACQFPHHELFFLRTVSCQI